MLAVLVLAVSAKAAPVDSAFSVNLDPSQLNGYVFEAEVGETVTQQVVLSSHRSYPILLKTRFNPANLAQSFQVPAIIELPANGTQTFTLSFTGGPTAPSEIYIGFFMEGDDGSGAGIPVRGRTILTPLSLPKSIQFATTKIGGSDCISLDLRNENKGNLTIKSIDFENIDGSRSFTVANAKDIDGIDGGKTVTAQLCFSPTIAAYSFADRLRVFYTIGKESKLYSAATAVVGLIPADEQPNYPDTGKPFVDNNCLQVREHPSQIFLGGQILDEIRITNISSSDLSVSATVNGPDANRFTLPTPDFTIPAKSTVTMPYVFDASDLGGFVFNSPGIGIGGRIECKISGSPDCSSATFNIFSTILFPPEKLTWQYEIVLPLFPPDKTVIALGSDVPLDHEYIVRLYNNLSTNIRIVDYKMEKGDHYQIQGGGKRGTVLTPNEQFGISLWGNQGGDPSITDDLLVFTENALTTQRFSFADPKVIAAVPSAPEDKPALIVSPNPMRSQAKFIMNNIQMADITIVNELGQEIYHSHSTSGEWSWNGRSDAGDDVAAGSYIVAVKGNDTTGKAFAETIMLIKH